MASCRYCDSPIGWNRIDGNWRPTNADGSAHFCKSDRRRIPDVAMKVGKTIVGENYRPVCGKCDLPPWEICACSFTPAERYRSGVDTIAAVAQDEMGRTGVA